MVASNMMSEADSKTLMEYLDRINHTLVTNGHGVELPSPTVENLFRIHKQHCLNIPFENLLFVHHKLRGTERLVGPDDLHRRLVQNARGGMCQEMNALLLRNLKILGYNCYAGLAAMVVDGTLKPATEPLQGLVSSQNLGSTQTCFGAHQIVLVTVEGATYLCDVGAGPKCLVEPVLLRAYDDTDDQGPSRQQPPQDWLAAGGESQQAGMRYRIRRGIMGSAQPLSTAAALVHPERESFVGYYLQYRVKDTWTDMYFFGLTPVTNTVLQACSDYSFRHHPLFTKHMLVSRVLPGGRVQLMDFVLKTRLEGQPTQERRLESEEERDEVLQEVFGLDLST